VTGVIIEYFFVLCIGLAFGSFVTMASYRLPRGEDIVVKPSHCPNCDARLRFPDLWPLLSWVLSRAKCRYCKTPVSMRYPLTELVTGAVFVLLFMMFGVSAQFLILALLWAVLMVMIVVDIEHYIIPDLVHVALLPLAIAWHWVNKTPPEEAVDGFLLAAGIALVLHYGYRWVRHREGLGFGDVKFLAMAGLWLGMKPIVPFLFLSGLGGVATGVMWRVLRRGQLFPFGPSLAVAMFLCIVFPEFSKLFWNIGNLVQ
jgi:leader peptidase (prepilin peptidase)/N-methyltransferase